VFFYGVIVFTLANHRDDRPREVSLRIRIIGIFAESIIKAHTNVAAPGYTVKEGRAAMGEYNHFLTVQQLIDIVAFLNQGKKVQGK
jgi:hypothetical protein